MSLTTYHYTASSDQMLEQLDKEFTIVTSSEPKWETTDRDHRHVVIRDTRSKDDIKKAIDEIRREMNTRACKKSK